MKQIRDLDIIEKELNECPVGVLALCIEEEKIIQVAAPFLYRDKNVYLFLDDSAEIFQTINYEFNVSFAIISYAVKNSATDGEAPSENNLFRSFAATISGKLKKPEEQKLIDDVVTKYFAKYSDLNDADVEAIKSKIIMIDTEEIQAFEDNRE